MGLVPNLKSKNQPKAIQVFLNAWITIHKEWCQSIQNKLPRLSH
jgi:hypothetical protein